MYTVSGSVHTVSTTMLDRKKVVAGPRKRVLVQLPECLALDRAGSPVEDPSADTGRARVVGFDGICFTFAAFPNAKR